LLGDQGTQLELPADFQKFIGPFFGRIAHKR
jgi:hypothetical protein